MKQKKGLQKSFIGFIREHLKDAKPFESPMAMYEWFVKEWGRPLSPKNQQQAYLAVWAISINDGMVNL